MQIAHINGANIHYCQSTVIDKPVIVFVNSLGSDFRLWDNVVDILKDDFHIIRYDKRGHGLSDIGDVPYSIELLADDLAALLEYLTIDKAIICGISVGGMIGQYLAASKPELVNALVLCNTAPKIGNEEFWQQRLEAIDKNGLLAISDSILLRWFSAQFKASKLHQLEGWRNMLSRTTKEGYMATSVAIKNADLHDKTKTIIQPTLCIGGDEDLSTPADLVEEMSRLIKGSHFKVIKNAGHLPCIEQPDILADHMIKFFKENNLV